MGHHHRRFQRVRRGGGAGIRCGRRPAVDWRAAAGTIGSCRRRSAPSRCGRSSFSRTRCLQNSERRGIYQLVQKTEQLDRSAPRAAIDVLINNAGGALGLETVAEGKDEDWETMLQTNVLGVLRMTRATLPLMLGNPGGSIINIGSYAAHTVYEGGAAYSAAKAGDLQITRTLRLELSGTGLRVCSVDPGTWRKQSFRWCALKAMWNAPKNHTKGRFPCGRKISRRYSSGWPTGPPTSTLTRC